MAHTLRMLAVTSACAVLSGGAPLPLNPLRVVVGRAPGLDKGRHTGAGCMPSVVHVLVPGCNGL